MKKILLALALIMVTAMAVPVSAQNINVNINIGRQPAWGPVGYDYAPYYYFPDINVYYDVNLEMFYYPNRGHWVSARYLPYAYSRYDLYHLYKVVINDNRPWLYNHSHLRSYGHFKGYRSQPVILYSKDRRYDQSRRNKVSWYDQKRDNKRDNNRYDRGRDVPSRNQVAPNGNNGNRGRNDNVHVDRNQNQSRPNREGSYNQRSSNETRSSRAAQSNRTEQSSERSSSRR